MRPKGGWRRWTARVLKWVPGSGMLLHWSVRLFQPRFNMGAVGVLLDEQGERVLVVEHVFHPGHPWGLPGGWINRGEDPDQTVVREMWEEVGLRVRAVRPLLISRAQHRGLMDVVYLCALDGEGQQVRLSRELLDYRWLRADELEQGPRLMAFHRAAIRLAFDGSAR